jgi:dephospho-CoA kinase
LTLRVGLTGGIACGKSRVLRRLAAAGLETLDLDRIAHEVTAPGGSAYRDVAEAFGPAVLGEDGGVDRKRLGELVFADPAARARLNAIVHPRVREEEARRVAIRPDHPGRIVVTDAALLVEAGVHLRFDRLVVVYCGADEQVRRLMERDGIDQAAARARIAAQMPMEEKRRFAHIELDTTGDLRETDRAADRLAFELRRLSRGRAPRVAVPLERRLAAMIAGPRRGPRGLDRGRILDDIAAGAGLEMERIARLLVPPADGPWYRAARPQGGDEGPEALAAPVVVWALSRHGPDVDFLAAAAASMARLTHNDPGRVAGACLYAVALQEAMVSGTAEALLAPLPGWLELARRWGGGDAPAPITAAVESAARVHADPIAARAARAGEPSGELAAGLVAATIGVPSSAVPPSLLETLAALDGF